MVTSRRLAKGLRIGGEFLAPSIWRKEIREKTGRPLEMTFARFAAGLRLDRVSERGDSQAPVRATSEPDGSFCIDKIPGLAPIC